MDAVINFLSRIEVIIAIIALIIILVVYLIIHRMTINKYRKEFNKLEVRYNSIKSIPLPFKLNKAVAIAKIDSKILQSVNDCQLDFEQCQNNLRSIAEELADADDNLVMGKTKPVKKLLLDLEAAIDLGEKQVEKLNVFLDSILEKETNQRAQVTALKEQFRGLKTIANEKSQLVAYAWPQFELKLSEIEKMFSAFEEWMYASDYEKATEELKKIEVSIKEVEYLNENLAKIIQVARYTLPDYMADINKRYNVLKQKGLYLNHLEVELNLNTIATSLKTDLDRIKNCDIQGIKDNLEDYRLKLVKLDEDLKNEDSSSEIINKIKDDINKILLEAATSSAYIHDEFEKAKIRFGIENLEELLEKAESETTTIKADVDKVFSKINEENLPYSKASEELEGLLQRANDINDQLSQNRDRLNSAKGDEERANKQLLKLQIIMNQMQVKIRTSRLPSISRQYEEDLSKAFEYVYSIKTLIGETPLNVKLLNSTLNDAIDFIYKLWNNVNNVVGTALMVENTIVFGNKYRSTYADIDSELTRAELCFRNGEYTQALKIAIATIEKIHPGSYEKLIKENSSAA
ncbi:MAG: septation ring formation regulator EzrA [Erysipelotrichaceae bacterium]|nr:septation ring formation regulator EzrA [Erysipelotrichaceae bacterium]MDY5251381.1 septation ring formation regulator EzrA [Erysipelotrichaceae bacterium]